MLLFLWVSRAAYTDQQVGIVGITSPILGVRLTDSLPFARRLYPSYAIEHEYHRRC